MRDAKPNDSLFLHYSGHGGQQWDENGDEEDGMDEYICPVDGKNIVDDEKKNCAGCFKPIISVLAIGYSKYTLVSYVSLYLERTEPSSLYQSASILDTTAFKWW